MLAKTVTLQIALNCPQSRIFGYKQIVYKNGWHADNMDKLKIRIKYCSKKLDLNAVRNMMGKI